MLHLPRHKLIHDVGIRWNMTRHVDVEERYTEQQPGIYSALLEKNRKVSIKNIAMLNDNEQKLAEELIQVQWNHTHYMILPLKEMILKSMAPADQDSPTVKEAKAAITNDLTKRYTDPNLQDYLQIVTVLDLRFKSLPYLADSSHETLYRNLI